MNNVVVIGRLVREPNLDYLNNAEQTAKCRFTLAVDRANGEGADFIPVVVWGKQAENCERYLAKGRQCAVVGRIQTGSYEKDGRTVYTTDVVAQRVKFLGSGKADEAPSDDREPAFQEADEELPF